MAWIESHQALVQHPKVLRLAKERGWSIDETIGKLHRFWWWCLDYAPDGRLDKFDHSTIAAVFGVESDGEKFVELLLKVNWLDFKPSIRVHDWWDYAGRFLQVRYKRTPKIWKEIKRFYGHSIQRTNNRTTTEQSAINNHKPNQPNLTKPNQPNLTKPLLSCDEASPIAAVWESYAKAYLVRYKTPPVRNAKVNGQLVQLVKRVGSVPAVGIAEFYVRHNDQFYVKARHPPGLLLRDCEGLHTQWKTGCTVTTTQAMQVDKQSAKAQMWREVAEELEQERRTINVQPG
jgi:hypothetical protein